MVLLIRFCYQIKYVSYLVSAKYGHQSQMADSHLGWAQMADAWCIGHLGLDSNFQPSLM